MTGNLSPEMRKEKKISEFTRICMENHGSVTGWQELFSHTNPSNFRQTLQSLLLRYG